MRKYVVVAAVVAAIGVAAGLYVVTDTPEMTKSEPVAALAAAADAPIDLSKVDIEAEYAKGTRTFPIISALADKRIAEGGRDAAIKLLEEYVAANPKDSRGHKRLIEQYQMNGRMEDYNRQVLALANADPTEENLRLLSYIYNGAKDYAKQAEVLRKIITVTNGKSPEVYVDLATVQRIMGDKESALKTLDELSAKHPSFNSYPLAYLKVSTLSEKGDVDAAFKIAQEWVNTPFTPSTKEDGSQTVNSRPQELADFCNILHYSGHADKAIALVESHLEMLESSPELVVAYVNATTTAGRGDHAYSLLQKIDEAGRMSPMLYPTYLDLAIKRDDKTAAEAIATKLDVATFNEEQALNILELARVSNAPNVHKILLTRFDNAALLEDKPVLTAVLAIQKKDASQDKKIEAALGTELSSTQRIRLAESCARAQKTACFEAIVKQFPAVDAMTSPQVVEYSQLYLTANRPSEIIDAVGARAASANSSADIQAAHRRLAAAAGRLDILKPWLEANAATAPINALQELFYLANNNHKTDVASDVAERLYARDPSPLNSDILTNALIAAGDVERALPLLREQVKDSGANDGLYVSTLAKYAPKNPALRKELADYAEASLRAERGDNRQQLNYAYIMINNGRKDAVIPYAKKYADSRGGEWKKLYSQLTAKPAKASAAAAAAPAKLTREQLIDMSKAKNISDANRRQIAFSLLSMGHKADALTIFEDLAKNKGPDSQEVKDLMYLWGGKLNAEQLAWLNSRVASASAYDKARWAELVNNTANDESLLRYVSSTPDALYNRPLRQKYFRILATTGNRQNYDEAMRDWVAQTTDVPALMDYATTAQGYSFSEAAANAYARILQIDPTNKKALSQTATMQYAKGKFSEANKSLDQYMAVQAAQPDTAPEENADTEQAHYFKGELLRRKGDKVGAEAEFRRVIEMINASGSQSPASLSRLYTAQFRVGEHEAAKAGFDKLLEQYPDNQSILADYMSALIEYRYLSEASRVANRYDKTSPHYGKGASLDLKSIVNSKETAHMDWFDNASADSHLTTVVEKPGYVVFYTPVSQELVSAAATAPVYSPEVEFQRQQQLRLQLLYAQIEQNSGQLEKAKERVAILKKYYPNDPQLMSYEASLAGASGNTAQAIQILQQVQIASPENEDIPVLISNLKRAGRSASSNFVKLDHSYRGLGDNREQITSLDGAARITDSAELGFSAQNDFVKTKGTRRASDGAIGDYDYTRQHGELYAAHNFNGGERLQGSLFANNKTAGAGAYLGFSNPLGRTELLGEYHRPYWDFVEAVAEHATRDRIGFKHFANPTKVTSFGLEASVNNYNIEGLDDVRKTALVRASVIQQLQAQTETQPYFGVGYGFDGEYKMGTPKTRLDGLGAEYFPLPLFNREIHSLTGIYQDDWRRDTHVRLLGGAAYDRFNSTVSPLVDGRITHDLNEQWQIGGHGRYAMETSNTDNRLFDVGADIMYKF